MANNDINYLAYCQIDGRKVVVHISAPTPSEVLAIVKDLFKEVSNKVENIRIADEASGFFVRDFS